MSDIQGWQSNSSILHPGRAWSEPLDAETGRKGTAGRAKHGEIVKVAEQVRRSSADWRVKQRGSSTAR